tara:strand:- start:747 stop:1829 length:1083 start_codon:yes stop_codon:yes gene_type:complete
MVFKDKNILVTGHTGFKGSWLSVWLSYLGANVIGVSNCIPTKPSHFELFNNEINDDYRLDIANTSEIKKIIYNHKPEFIFHLAAQPIVLESYNNPLNTFETNVLGTANILDALRQINHECIAIIITSDKAYDNVEWTYGYRETDNLGGKDPYSGSKGAAELLIKSYVESFFKKDNSNISIGIGRAGNVIGGGDWASHRIVPDCIKSWSKNKAPEIRSPNATRPWQHVLEPLSGYLTLASKLSRTSKLNGEPFNFGPPADQNFSVAELVDEMLLYWKEAEWLDKSSKNNDQPNEAGLLKLNCDKALHLLDWKATLNFEETAQWTTNWYLDYYKKNKKLNNSLDQIKKYMQLASERNSFPDF